MIAISPNARADDAAFDQWFARITELCRAKPKPRDNPLFQDHRFEWTVEDTFVPSADELARLRAKAVEHPESSVRFELQRYDHVLAGESTERHRLWLHDGQWRLCQDFGSKEWKYLDRAVTREHAWSMSERGLDLFDPAKAFPPTQDLRSDLRSFETELQSVLTGGLVMLIPSGAPIPSHPRLEGTHWSASWRFTGSSLGPTIVTASGTWDPGRSVGTVSEGSVVTEANAKLISQYRTTKWAESLCLGVLPSAELEEYRDDGALHRRLRLSAIETIQPSEFAPLVVTPELAGTDAVRGRVTFTSVIDGTKEDPIITTESPGGQLTSIPLSRTPARMDSRRLEILGWVVGGTLLAALVALRIKRGRGL